MENVSLLLFIFLIGLLCFTDLKERIVPNFIVIPATIIGAIITGNYLQTIALFIIGAFFFANGYWRGGDVKLSAMLGAYLGNLAFIVFPLWIVLVFAYGFLKDRRRALPMAPFAALSSVIIVTIERIFN